MVSGNGLIYVGIPRERIYIPDFVDNRDRILGHLQNSGKYGGHCQPEGHRVDRNRDHIVDAFLEEEINPEWLLMLDSDMIHPPSVGNRLVEWNKPIVGGLYFHRGRDHAPLCFNESDTVPDKYGQDALMWTPVRDEVYQFLIQNRIPMKDGAFTIDDSEIEPLLHLEKGGIGTGSIIIHRDVIEKMEAPWFEYRVGNQSEDLTFCKRAREIGYEIYVDLSTISGHMIFVPIGQAQFRMIYEARGLSFATPKKDEIPLWFGEHFGWGDVEIEELENYNTGAMSAIWGELSPDTPKDVLAFYNREDVGKLYVYDLLRWNTGGLFESLRKKIIPYRNKRALVFGGGIGTTAIQLAIQQCNVTMVEPNDILRNFASYRWEYIQENVRGKKGTIDFLKSLGDAPDAQEIVVAIDVFEHIHPDALYQTMVDLSSKMQFRCRLFFHNNWSQQDIFPFHYDSSEIWEDANQQAGLFVLDNFWSLKVE